MTLEAFLQAGGYTRVTADTGAFVLSHTDNTTLVMFKASDVRFQPFYRRPSETFRTACAREILTAHVVCNGPYFAIPGNVATFGYVLTAHLDGSSITQEGQVYITGTLMADSTSVPSMFYVNWETDGTYTFGEGDPANGYNAIGNLTPLILSSFRPGSAIRSPIRFGDRNLYDAGAETNVAQAATGDPAQAHEDNLTQRSNRRNGQLVAGQGIVALGLNRDSDLLVVLVRDNAQATGASEHEARSAIEHFEYWGCVDAVAFDVSTSCTMRTKHGYYATPDRRKDNSIEVGFAIASR